MKFTNHAVIRMSQRNIKESQLEIILDYGSKVRDGVLFTLKDAKDAIIDNPSLKDQIMRCINVAVILLDGVMISVMRANKRKNNSLTRC